MKALRFALIILAFPSLAWPYGTDADSGLLFNDTKYTLGEPMDPGIYHGVKSALLVYHDDVPERKHDSNSSMASIMMHVIAPGGGAKAHRVEDFREQVFFILEGEVDFSAEGEVLSARAQDVVFIPPGMPRSFTVKGDKSAKVLQAEWFQKGPRPEKAGKAFITGERFHTPVHTGGEGYLTVTPNARQQGIPLSITGYGAGHANSKNALLLYPRDFPAPRPFTANTVIGRMGLSAYGAGGGTRTHFHADREQCFVILGGKALFEIGANTIEVKAGDVVFVPRHVWHGYKTTGEEPFKFFEVEWGRN